MTQMEVDKNKSNTSDLEKVTINGEKFLKITHSNNLRPFFMSIVSNSNHWMFLSSNGGVTAGRRNSESALFPYYTDDKITESYLTTGSKTIIKVNTESERIYWEPFTNKSLEKFNVSRHLYKNIYGNKVLFEEINHDLQISFKYQLATSDLFGFVKESSIQNLGVLSADIEVIDGFQNILPAGVESDLQRQSSNLVDAYKRNELESKTGLGIFALSAVPVDKAEPSEALLANVAWSLSVKNPTYLLSSLQLANFRRGESIQQEDDVKAEKGAYLIHQSMDLPANEYSSWKIIADVDYNHARLIELQSKIQKNDLDQVIKEDIELGTTRLKQLVAGADGIQHSNDDLRDIRHFSNSLFNIMRGGIFDDNYSIDKVDFTNYLQKANNALYQELSSSLNKLSRTFSHQTLMELSKTINHPDFTRLSIEYLPLKFSRRHGDPSRPWNQFSINTRDEDGKKVLDYEGNWRDIFQNWESLAHSYPNFIEGMIFKFLNATTFDGYNPYRVTKDGFDWEIIEPDDPWSYIGYWGDHQIIYLLKFLEFYEAAKPGAMQSWFNKNVFVYANVPYLIKPYAEILKDPKDTIVFDHDSDAKIRANRDKIGADGALLRGLKNDVIQVNFIEKILATTLAKLSNFIPEAGIWMNTQRPEWNDANNALVGNGVSMVTLAYLRRFLGFFKEVFHPLPANEKYSISAELGTTFYQMKATFSQYKELLHNSFNDQQRKQILDELGVSASDFRTKIYHSGFSGESVQISVSEIKDFITTTLAYLDHSIIANERQDALYHAYNLVTISEEKVEISRLDEMLEGQVAILSSGTLNGEQSLNLLNALKSSALFRPDQYSYLLYPNKELKGFLDRNQVPEKLVKSSKLLSEMIQKEVTSIIEKDIDGNYHFNAKFNNAKKLQSALENLPTQYHNLVKEEKQLILAIYEQVFNHKSFTGRSGTFYGYEGLGSIYWHMVSKLQLAVQETSIKAIEDNASAELIGKLLEHYYEINAGIGVHKSPKLYGAFPTDPYSHTPYGKGAQQPGMTGQVKEDVLSRFGELGLQVKNGKLIFSPDLLRKEEFLKEEATTTYFDLSNQSHELKLAPNSLFFTYCQVPVVYYMSNKNKILLTWNSGKKEEIEGNELSEKITDSLFGRKAEIKLIQVHLASEILK